MKSFNLENLSTQWINKYSSEGRGEGMGVYDSPSPPPPFPRARSSTNAKLPWNLGLRQFFPQLVAALTSARIEKLKLVSFAEVSLVS